MESLFGLILGGSRDPMKQTKAHETKFKQPQNGIRLSLKLTPRNKRNKTSEKIRGEDICKEKTICLIWKMMLAGG